VSSDFEHQSVLLKETMAALAPRPGGCYIDATVGLGGHAEWLLEASSPDGRLLGLDADPDSLERAAERLARFGPRAQLIHGNFRDLASLASDAGFGRVDGVLFDLGVSSFQLGPTGRGFSFQYDAPLDMRLDPALDQTAADLVNELGVEELAHLFRRFGEEPEAGRIARAIAQRRPISTTRQLADAVGAVLARRGARIHPATRTFQALRIAVNDELGALPLALTASVGLLRPSGRLAVIAFHSLEDRIVKEVLRSESRDCLCPPRLPICVCGHRATLRLVRGIAETPSADERAANPRSRSARLRVAERIEPVRRPVGDRQYVTA
jgi:16S rRNA (cytosine1402-N4)-methyltransferase